MPHLLNKPHKDKKKKNLLSTLDQLHSINDQNLDYRKKQQHNENYNRPPFRDPNQQNPNRQNSDDLDKQNYNKQNLNDPDKKKPC